MEKTSKHVLRACDTCHTEHGGAGRELALGAYLPGGVLPEFGEAEALGGQVVRTEGGGAAFVRPKSVVDTYRALNGAPSDKE